MYGIHDGAKVIARFVTPMSIRSNHPVFASDTLSLSRQISRRSAQRWEIETNLEPLSATAQDLFVNIVTKGYHEVVTVITPQNYGAKLATTATSVITASGTQGANVVTFSNNNGIVQKGTFIKFANHTKVYITTTDRSSDGTVGIYPNLKTAMTAQAVSYRDDVVMACSYDLDTVSGMIYSDGILMDMGTIKLIERLQ